MLRRLALALALLAVTPPRQAVAHERSRTPGGAALRWAAPVLPYDVVFELGDPPGEALASSTRRAFDGWATALRGARTLRWGGPAALAVRDDGRVTVQLEPGWDPTLGDPERTVALTLLVYDAASGALRDADIRLNAATFRFGDGEPGAFDTESVVLHEAGHALGLAHSCGLPDGRYPSCFQVPDEPPGHAALVLDAVMAPTLALGTRRRALGPDDLAGLVESYPVGPEVVAPRLDALRRRCPSGALLLTGAFPARAELYARRASGAAARLALAPGSTTSTLALASSPFDDRTPRIDLLVRDPETRAAAALVDLVAPEACARDTPEPSRGEPDDGCACAGVPRLGAGPGALLLLLLAAALALRRAPSASRARRPRGRGGRARRLAPLPFALVLALRPDAALGYACSRAGAGSGPSLYWQERTIPWWASSAPNPDVPDSGALLEELRLGFAAWEAVDCSDLALPLQGSAADLVAGYSEQGENRNVVVFVAAGWAYDAGAIAITTNAYDTRTGRILDSDVELNRVQFRFTVADAECDPKGGRVDVRNTITHEVGHVFGLDHPPNAARYADTTMFASAPPCETKKRSLAPDDIDGLCAIYPAGQPVHPCYPADSPGLVEVESGDGFEGGCSVRGPGAGPRSGRGPEGVAASLLLLGVAALGRGLGRRARTGRRAAPGRRLSRG